MVDIREVEDETPITSVEDKFTKFFLTVYVHEHETKNLESCHSDSERLSLESLSKGFNCICTLQRKILHKNVSLKEKILNLTAELDISKSLETVNEKLRVEKSTLIAKLQTLRSKNFEQDKILSSFNKSSRDLKHLISIQKSCIEIGG